jgi:predicted GNAT superfamily acetyltransferase
VTEIAIRDLDGIQEYRRAVAFQESIWGDGFSERVPASLMKVTQRVGGVVAGAFDADREMVGFVYGMTGVVGGEPVHWSDILAIRPGLRDRGLGRRLKAYQREKVLEVGATRMHWTFDPLESRNAYLNLGRLGAVVREYAVDMYGVSDSPLHRGLGTDRFVVTWELDTVRVEERLGGARPPDAGSFGELPVAFRVEIGGVDPSPTVPDAGQVTAVTIEGLAAGGLRLPVPADIQGLRDRAPATAVLWRSATRAVLQPLIGDGWEVRELVRDPARPSHLSFYILVPPPDTPPERETS